LPSATVYLKSQLQCCYKKSTLPRELGRYSCCY